MPKKFRLKSNRVRKGSPKKPAKRKSISNSKNNVEFGGWAWGMSWSSPFRGYGS